MDNKYKNIKTINQLDLSRGSRTSLSSGSSGSGKTDFSTKSKENRFNEAYKKDFKTSPKNEAGPKMKSASPPKKKKEETDSKNKIKNPLSGRLVSMEYYKKLVKSGKIKEGGAGVAKRESPVAKKESPVVKRESPKKSSSNKIEYADYKSLNALAFYDGASNIIQKYKDKGLNGTPLNTKQIGFLNLILNDIDELLSENKGDKEDYNELPSVIDYTFQRVHDGWGEETYLKYIFPFSVYYDKEGANKKNILEWELDTLLDKVYKNKSSSSSSK